VQNRKGRPVDVLAQVFESNEPLGFGELLREAAKFVDNIEKEGGYVCGIDRNLGTSEITGECDLSLIIFYELWTPDAKKDD